jgi:hypothetical protein
MVGWPPCPPKGGVDSGHKKKFKNPRIEPPFRGVGGPHEIGIESRLSGVGGPH